MLHIAERTFKTILTVLFLLTQKYVGIKEKCLRVRFLLNNPHTSTKLLKLGTYPTFIYSSKE